MLPRNIFDNSHTIVVILVLFEQFLGKFCLNFLPLNLSVSPNMMHFVRAFSMVRTLGVRLIVNEKARNCGKTQLSKTCLKMGGGGMHPPCTPPWIRPCPH